MLCKAAQAVIAAFDHDPLRARVALQRLAIVEHLVAGFYQQQVARWRYPRRIEFAPFLEVCRGEFVRLAGVQVLLRTEIGGESDMRLDRRIDQDRPPAPGFDRMSRVVTTERGTDIARTRTACDVLDDADRFARGGRQLRAGKFSR